MSKKRTGGSYPFDDEDDFDRGGGGSDSDRELSDHEDEDEIEDDVGEDDVEDDFVEDTDVDDDDEQKGGDGEEDEIGVVEGVEGLGDADEDKEETTKGKKVKQIPRGILDDDDDDEDGDGESYLKKFDSEINQNYIVNFHPECALQNYDEIVSMTKVVRDKNGIIIDDLHKTIPYLTKYEKARILGQRAKQINSGATPFVKIPENVIDGYLIAQLELEQKRIPFIIRRPLPNGGSEYWSLKDLENISF
jgi:DNA-directed RNA polymerase I, II, and III subunit RPABC2